MVDLLFLQALTNEIFLHSGVLEFLLEATIRVCSDICFYMLNFSVEK